MSLKLADCINRYNESVYELYLAEKFLAKANQQDYIRSCRNAAEAISQATEWFLKYYLQKHLSGQERNYLPIKPNIKELISKFINDDGTSGDYFYETLEDIDEPTVDFKYLLSKKGPLTNYSKHNGENPNFEVIEQYISKTKTFIKEYVDNKTQLSEKADFDKNNAATWDSLYSSCDRFNSDERTLILIIGPNQNIDKHHLSSLSFPKWSLIIDFDYDSEKEGFYKAAYSDKIPPPHRYKISDSIDTNAFSIYSQTHYHWFADNFSGSGESKTVDFTDWNRKYGKKSDLFIKSFSEVFSNQKTIVLSVYNSRRHIDTLCRLIDQHFGSNTTFVFANDLKNELIQVAEDWKGIKINISLTEVSEGLNDYSSNFGALRKDSGKYIIPHNELSESPTSGELTPAEFAQLEEHFEVIHKGLPVEQEGEFERRQFLTGAKKISWYGLKRGIDAQKRNFQKSYIRPLERVFENSRGKITLVHDAGFGGTTIARRIAWYFHDDYPTLLLKNYKDTKVRELLVNLHQKTRKTIFLILEVPQTITLDEVDNLYKSIPQARPVVFLIVKRGKPKNESDLAVVDWGNDVSELINIYKPYLENYENEEIRSKKIKEFDEIIYSDDPIKKTPFYIGLLTFEEDFFAIKEYIKKFYVEISNKEEQKRALLYLSICHDYIGQGLPSFFFKKLFKVQSSAIFRLENFFLDETGIIDSLLSSSLEGTHKFWRIKHSFFAKELKHQLLSGTSENPEIWKQALPDLCCNFIWDSISDGNVTEYIQETLQKLFIGNRKDRAGTSFTQIILDIETLDGKERVFKSLKDAYPDNPHFCSHLARFYAYHNKNRELALKYADEAIRLSLAEGKEDPLLYHIKGMCLRANIYDIIDRHIHLKRNGKDVLIEEYDEVINTLIPECASQFAYSRNKTKENSRSDEYGFIANIQLLIKAIDYGIIMSDKSKILFFKLNPEPFTEWLDKAESLLEEVTRINLDDDESGKIEDCINDILEFYENYDQILQNLRNQLDKSKNPSRTRRQIVRTYIRKKENYHTDANTISNILSLMEANIENEPDNERNFYLWFQAARYSRISLDDAIGKIAKWKANSNAIDAIYYFYILKVIRALQGYSESTQDAWNLIRECKQKGRLNITVYEWLGKGDGLNKLVNKKDITSDNKTEKLQLIEGYFTEYLHDGNGKITIVDKLEVFFSPTQARLTSNDINQVVQFYLGFSYDGLRADSQSVRIKGNEPRNQEQLIGNEIVGINTSEDVNDKIENNNEKQAMAPTQKKSTKRHLGKIIDLQKPPFYTWGKIENEFGKIFIFHKDNEINEVFEKLKIGDQVSYCVTINEKGNVAHDIEIIS
jgi:hypothetical protein